MRLLATYIGRVCFKNLLACSTNCSHVMLRLVCEDIYHKFNIQVSMEVMSRLFRHSAGMVSTVVDGNEEVSDSYYEQIPALTQFCLTNCERLRGFPKSLTTWNTDHHFFSPSQVLDFGRATGTPIPSEVVPLSASRSGTAAQHQSPFSK